MNESRWSGNEIRPKFNCMTASVYISASFMLTGFRLQLGSWSYYINVSYERDLSLVE